MTPPRRVPLPSQERAFLQSVVYASLFDYPLAPEQLCDALIGERADETTLLSWYRNSPALQAAIDFRGGQFFPRGRDDLLVTRAARERTSRRLLDELSAPLRFVTHLPFVRMVALSGSLAHLNAEASADLDLFVITSPRRVWTVTVTCLAIARVLGWRRRLCLNYVISERSMWIAPADLFSANQIIHLRPVTGGEAYRRFLDANRFVERFYPNFRGRSAGGRERSFAARARAAVEHVLDWTIAPLAEIVCRFVYRSHLQRRSHTWKSREQVRLEPECLKLHTSSHRQDVMERFEEALERTVAHAVPYAATRGESSPQPACL